MDYTSIVNSDFFASTMIDVMSPIQLYHLRCLSKFINTYITIKNINDKIILNLQNRLQYELGNDYDKIIKIITNRNVTIYGPIVTESIWEEYHKDTYIDLRLTNEDMTFYDNIFTDLIQIYPISPYLYHEFSNWFSHGNDLTTIINKIRLYMTLSETDWYDDCDSHYETFPILFQNKITIDNTGKWLLTITNLKAVMHKKYVKSDYYHSYDFKNQETEEALCSKYNL